MEYNYLWHDANKELPPCNTLVVVMTTNGIQRMDFVNEPFNKEMPFQHYVATNWRMPTTEEMRAVMRRINNK